MHDTAFAGLPLPLSRIHRSRFHGFVDLFSRGWHPGWPLLSQRYHLRAAPPRSELIITAHSRSFGRAEQSGQLHYSARIGAVGDGTMADGSYADGLLGVDQLVENPVGADAERAKASQFAAQGVSGMRFALKQTEGVLDRVDQRPVKLEQLEASAAREDEPCQRSVCGCSALGKLAAKLGKADRLTALDLGETRLQRGKRVRVGEDLCGLLQSLVLIDRHQRRGGRTVSRHQHVVAPVADIVEQAAEVAAQLAHGNRLRHARYCTRLSTRPVPAADPPSGGRFTVAASP